MKRGWQGLLQQRTPKPTRLQNQPPSGRLSFQPQTPSVLWPSFRRTNETRAAFQLSFAWGKTQPSPVHVRTRHTTQRTIIPWPHLWAQGVWQPTRQNNHQTGQAESQVNPRHWEQLVTEKGSFKTYRDVGIAKKVVELLGKLSFLPGRSFMGWAFVQNEMTSHTSHLDQNWTDSSNFEWVLCPWSA